MKTSFSALNTFQSCPLKYKFQQIDKIRTPKSPEAVFGTLIHSTMNFIHTGNFILPNEKEALHHFSSNWNSDVFDDEIKERAAFASGIKIIQDYYKNNDPSAAKIVGTESRFTIEVVDEGKKESHFVSGFIDRIDKTDDGYEIIDYKTSKKLPPQSTVDESLQLLIYLLAFQKRYPKEKNLDKIKLSLFFLQHSAKLTTTKKKKDLKEGRKKIVELINEIEKSDFPPVVTPLCDWCGYQKQCPMWSHKFKKEEDVSDKEKKRIIEEYLELQEEAKSSRKKIKELQEKILGIMEKEKADRLFGDEKIIAKNHRKTFGYDEKKLREILEKAGKWDEVVKVNATSLKKVIATLPSEIKDEIENLKELKSESWGLSIKKR